MAKQGTTDVTREFHGDSSEVLAALNDVLSSSSFANADRLKNFLEYVVLETVHGRAESIRGKTIAQDVYGRSAATDGDPENVVRVDARRLRRRLTDYYSSEGSRARIRIHIDSGGYSPRFEYQPDMPSLAAEAEKQHKVTGETAVPRRLMFSPLMIGGLAAVLIAALSVSYALYVSGPDSGGKEDENRTLERQALLEKSPASLQAVNMAEQARSLMFPISDPQRQKLALGFFERAQELDPDYFGGYAGAAQAVGTLALLTPDATLRQQLRDRSMEFARKAIDLRPTAAWAQSAAGWAHFINRDFEEALRLSSRAYAMENDDPTINATYGAIALVNGEFELARNLSDPRSATAGFDQKLGTRNTFAIANYFLGNYPEVIRSFRTAAELGEPISPLNMAFEIAAYHALNQKEEAQKKLRSLTDNWPGLPLEEILRRAFRDPAKLDEVFGRLKDLGWTSS